jgi:hypothetical protein
MKSALLHYTRAWQAMIARSSQRAQQIRAQASEDPCVAVR